MTDEDLKTAAAVILSGPADAIHRIPAKTAAYMVYELLGKRQIDIGGPDFGRLARVAGIRQPDVGRCYRIEIGVMPLLNETQRDHHMTKMKRTRALAWEVRAALMQLGWRLGDPSMPLASILVERHQTGVEPDHDNIVGGCKKLLDVLQPFIPPSPKTGKGGRQYGLGVIAGDGPKHLSAEYRHVPCKRGQAKTVITIRELLA